MRLRIIPRHNLYGTFVGRWEQGHHSDQTAYSRHLDWIPITISTAAALTCITAFVITRIVVLS
jgi:hypothetical protein